MSIITSIGATSAFQPPSRSIMIPTVATTQDLLDLGGVRLGDYDEVGKVMTACLFGGIGAVIGAIPGAAAGAYVGSHSGAAGGAVGAVIGGVAGAAIGATIGAVYGYRRA